MNEEIRFVAGCFDDEGKWSPCRMGESYNCSIQCRRSILNGENLYIPKEDITLKASECYVAKSALKAKEQVPKSAKAIVVMEPEVQDVLAATAYVDGSFRDGRYGYGVVLFIGDEKQEFSGGDIDKTGGRQVNGEVEAALIALHTAQESGCKSIEIFYDYEGIRCWANGIWKANKDFTAFYRDTVRNLRESMDIRFHHIKSHTGNPYNERADELAKLGTQEASAKQA